MSDRPGEAEWVGEPLPEVAHQVCHQFRELLCQWALPTRVVEDAALVVAELLANVVEHARTTFRLAVRLHGRLLHVDVDDSYVGATPAQPHRPSSGKRGGLRLVNTVALRWGWTEHETGKTVWAEFVE